MNVNPYLTFDGQCEAAFKFYEQVLGGSLGMMMRYADSPMPGQVAPDMRDKVMHTRLQIGDMMLMGSDAPCALHRPMAGFSVALGVDDPTDAERIFNAFAEGGTVQMPLQETFWARSFGMLVDRFGTPWMINCERPT